MPEKYVVVANALNVRKEPSMRGAVIGILPLNAQVDVIGRATDGYWYKIQAGTLTGWASHKYLRVAAPNGATYPWHEIALAEVGVKEFTGSADNPRIVEYLSSTTLRAPSRNNDETYWCSAFANWCMETAGYEGTDSAWARSWLQWGQRISDPVPGCIVVFERGKEGGHVGFYVGESGSNIQVLGGNQNDEVRVSDYPKTRLLGMRMPGQF